MFACTNTYPFSRPLKRSAPGALVYRVLRFIANCADVPQLIPRIAQGNGGTR